MNTRRGLMNRKERGVSVTEYGIVVSLLTVTAFWVFPTLADLWTQDFDNESKLRGGQAYLSSTLEDPGNGGGSDGGEGDGDGGEGDGGGSDGDGGGEGDGGEPAEDAPWVDPFTIQPSNQIVLTSGSSPSISILGGAITYGAGGPDVPISLQVLVNGVPQTIFHGTGPEADPSALSNLGDLGDGTTLDFTGTSYYPPGHRKAGKPIYTKSTTTSNPMIIPLRNGDYVPDYTPFDQQPDIKDFLGPVIDPATSKVTIADNQVLYIMELGTNNTSSPAADFQDLVFLISF